MREQGLRLAAVGIGVWFVLIGAGQAAAGLYALITGEPGENCLAWAGGRNIWLAPMAGRHLYRLSGVFAIAMGLCAAYVAVVLFRNRFVLCRWITARWIA